MPIVGDKVTVQGFGPGEIVDYIKDEMNLPFAVKLEDRDGAVLRFSENSFEELPE